MTASSELTNTFVELVKAALSPSVNQAIAEGRVEVHIGFSEVNVYDDSSYPESLIRPFVHIVPRDIDEA